MQIDGYNTKGETKLYKTVNLNIQTFDGVVKICAIVVEDLPTRISMSGRNKFIDEIGNGIRLADDSKYDSIECLHMIIGLDKLKNVK